MKIEIGLLLKAYYLIKAEREEKLNKDEKVSIVDIATLEEFLINNKTEIEIPSKVQDVIIPVITTM